MRRLWMAAAVVAASVVMASPAAADWQWTKWGMSQADVKAAGAAKGITDYDGGNGWTLRVNAPYTVGNFTFDEVQFRFIDDKLTMISLKASAEDLDRIEQAVSGGVGKPVSAEYGRYPKRIWLDRERGNTIELRTIGDRAVLNYTPADSGF